MRLVLINNQIVGLIEENNSPLDFSIYEIGN